MTRDWYYEKDAPNSNWLSGTEKKSDDLEDLYLIINKDDVNARVCFDPITKEIIEKEFNPDDIVGIYSTGRFYH